MLFERKKAALIIEAIRGHERDVMRGIAKDVCTRSDWMVYQIEYRTDCSKDEIPPH